MENSKKALVLGGGGSKGSYEIGVWKALDEMGFTFDLITGSSVGSINAALMAQGAFDASLKLWQELDTSLIFDIDVEKSNMENEENQLNIGGIPKEEAFAYIKELISNGGAGTSGLKKLLNEIIDEDAIRKSKINMGLVTVSTKKLTPLTLFKDDIPKGKLVDYILASSSCFPAARSYEIDGEHYIDGSYFDILPVEMAFNKGASDFICVYLGPPGIYRDTAISTAKNNSKSFFMIKSPWNLGNPVFFDRKIISRNIHLGYLETMKTFGKYYGNYYTFDKNSFSIDSIDKLDSIGNLFNIDPSLVYNSLNFDMAIFEKIKDIKNDFPLLNDSSDSTFSLPELIKGGFQNDKLVIIIAQSIKEKGVDSIFLSKASLKYFRSQVIAAHFILKKGWVH